MNCKLLKIIAAFLLMLGMAVNSAYAEEGDSSDDEPVLYDMDTSYNYTVPQIDPAAMQIYKEAAANTNRRNGNCDIQIIINSPLGNINGDMNILFQKNPFLTKTVLKAHYITPQKENIPIITVNQYIQTAGTALTVYSSAQVQNQAPKWTAQKYVFASAQQLDMLMQKVFESYEKQTADQLAAVKKLHLINEDDKMQHLQLIFDNKKLFDPKTIFASEKLVQLFNPPTANFAASAAAPGKTPSPEDIKMIQSFLSGIFTALQNSPDVSATIDIDKNTHKIVSGDLDFSAVVRTTGAYIYDFAAKMQAQQKGGIAAQPVITAGGSSSSQTAADLQANPAVIHFESAPAGSVGASIDGASASERTVPKKASSAGDTKAAAKKNINITKKVVKEDADLFSASPLDNFNKGLPSKGEVEAFLNNTTMHIKVTNKDIDDIMKLAVPSDVEKSAQRAKVINVSASPLARLSE